MGNKPRQAQEFGSGARALRRLVLPVAGGDLARELVMLVSHYSVKLVWSAGEQ